MVAATKLLPQGRGLARVLLQRASRCELDWETRQKSRFSFTDSAGRQIDASLGHDCIVRGGDVLLCEDGSLVQIGASAQAVWRITHCPAHGTPLDLLRVAYELGKRQVPLEVKPEYLQMSPNPALAPMLRAMHLIVTEVSAPFEPEAAVSALDHVCGHDHDHAHEHTHHHHDCDHSHPQHTAHAHHHCSHPHSHQHVHEQHADKLHQH